MEPNRLGRVLGVGTRVAANLVRERVNQASAAAPAAAQSPRPARAAADFSRNLQNYQTTGARAANGMRRFGQAMWNPFAHATGTLWLEITGLFFGLFTFYFVGNGWRFRHDWSTGPDHRKFLLYAVCGAIFFYFTVSSFLRASRRNRAKRAR